MHTKIWHYIHYSLLTGGMVISAVSAAGFGVGTAYPGIVITAAAVFSAGKR
jgi:hypothetical protein